MLYDPSRLSQANDFHDIWKPICDFLLVINSNLGTILHHLATIHPRLTDQQTDNNRATDALYSIAVSHINHDLCGRCTSCIRPNIEYALLTILLICWSNNKKGSNKTPRSLYDSTCSNGTPSILYVKLLFVVSYWRWWNDIDLHFFVLRLTNHLWAQFVNLSFFDWSISASTIHLTWLYNLASSAKR